MPIIKLAKWLFEPFFYRDHSNASPDRKEFRNEGKRAAMVFVHGFSGDAQATWEVLIDFISRDTSLAGWDIFGLGFPSKLRIDVPNVWSADPDLSIVAKALRTTMSLEPFSRYRAIAIAAHSMGGLVVQRALLDDDSLRSRVTHCFLFGSPSGGLPKTRLVMRLKRQLRDMSPESEFILALRKDWKEKFGEIIPFVLKVVAGDRDEFVPPSSSLQPFPENVLAVVPGNHVEIVRPMAASHQSVRLIVDSLNGASRPLRAVDSARLAVELGRYKSAVATLLPQAGSLDDNALVSLALALEGVGRDAEALDVLEKFCKGGMSSTDALGTLAGRLKRRWLISRNAIDHSKALDFYRQGFEQAEAAQDCAQVYYHAINIAFLLLMKLPPASEVTPECKEMAKKALENCQKCLPSQWQLATEGEAHLILGNLKAASDLYRQAIKATTSQREIDSMYAQAFRVAERIYGEAGLSDIEEVFGLK